MVHAAQIEAEDKANCAFGNCQVAGLIQLGFAALVGLIIWCRREAVELTAELLRMSATAFKANLSLLWTTGLLSIGMSFLIISPLGLMAAIGAVPYQAAVAWAGCPTCSAGSPPYLEKYADCDGFSQGDVQPIIPLVSFVGFMMLWAGLLSRELRVANVGGAIGLHYFEQDTGSNRSFTSLKWALTKSFGSLCFASLILAAVELMSRMVEHARNEARRGDNIALKIVVEILACLWRLVEVYVNFLTKMATIALAITAEPFCTSGKNVHKMLMRHNLDGILVDAFAGFTLMMLGLAVATGLGFGTWFIMDSDEKMDIAAGVLSGVIGYVVLSAIAGIVLVTCNTHYMCYILDLDHSFAPSNNTIAIHDLYKRAIDDKIGALKKSGGWAKTGAGKREAAAAAPAR